MPYADLGPRLKTATVLILGFLGLFGLAIASPPLRWFLLAVGYLAVAACSYEIGDFAHRRAGRVLLFFLYNLTLVLPAFLVLCYYTLSRPFIFSLPPESLPFWGRFLAPAVGLSAVAAMLLVVIESRVSLEWGQRVATDLFWGVALVGMGGASLLSLSLWPQAIFWLVLVVALNDSAAYFTGSRVGGPKLCPPLSPGKTVSGSVGGVVVGGVAGVAAGGLLGPLEPGGMLGGAALSMAVVVGAQVADLGKSFLKRVHGVKDSGTLLPGHGGVLDRLDGVLGGSAVLALHALWVHL